MHRKNYKHGFVIALFLYYYTFNYIDLCHIFNMLNTIDRLIYEQIIILIWLFLTFVLLYISVDKEKIQKKFLRGY